MLENLADRFVAWTWSFELGEAEVLTHDWPGVLAGDWPTRFGDSTERPPLVGSAGQ